MLLVPSFYACPSVPERWDESPAELSSGATLFQH